MRHTPHDVYWRYFRLLVIVFAALVLPHRMLAAEPTVSFVQRPGLLTLRIDDVDVADYAYSGPQVSRPYFAHVKTRSGIQVTRNHPPQKGQDAVDHEGLHTGIWLSFGDLSGCDYWRLKARTEHGRFLEPPTGGTGSG
ncbi:MAG: hypothetical protein JWN70_4370, partial [Planctomycetaceae bacterium]|nr:hypothetical protein [Planctomycetaceae bacterium]